MQHNVTRVMTNVSLKSELTQRSYCRLKINTNHETNVNRNQVEILENHQKVMKPRK